MLGKIIKHEFKATYKGYLLLFVSLFAITLLNMTVEYVPLHNSIWSIVKALLFVAWILLIAFFVMAAMILAVVRFYKTMVKDEGYLTHTLPVKKSHLIIGKFITSLVWVIVSVIIMIVAIFMSVASKEFIEDIIKLINEFGRLISSNPEIVRHLVLFIIMCIVAFGASIFQFYASVAMGQMFSGHKIAGSVLFYFIINYALSILSMVIMFVIPDFVDRMESTNELTSSQMLIQEGLILDEFMIITIVMQLIGIAICYFITNYRFSKKLNLD